MIKNHLFTPGPTEIPAEVLLAMAQPAMHHRTPQFQAIFKAVSDDLKQVFCTNNDVYILSSTGTGAMEAAVVNFASAGEKVIVALGGKFAERWQSIAQAYGVNVVAIPVEYGDPVDPALIEKALKENPDAKAVYTSHSETSTATVNDLQAIGAIVKKTDAILVTDGITSVGVLEVRPDDWAVDVVVSGSQKGFMMPPGLAFITASEKAWKRLEAKKGGCYYFDLKAAKKNLASNTTPWTTPTHLIFGLRAALDLILKEGIENVWKRSSRLAEATRKGLQAMNLTLFSKRPADSVTAANVPAGVDGKKFVKVLRDSYGVGLAGGQGSMEGKIFRISHMGYTDERDIAIVLDGVERVLSEMGYAVAPGTGIKAAAPILQAKG